jgi:hypothetical protein
VLVDPVSPERIRSFDTGLCDEGDIHQALLAASADLGEIYPGRNGQLVERIVPMRTRTAHAASLSSSYGLRPLPLHVDTAHRVTPARWVVIACVKPGTRSVVTRLVDWREIRLPADDLSLLKSATFLIRTGRRSFYSTILSDHRPFIRYDPGCMEPTDKRGFEAMARMENALANSTQIKIDWCPGRLLIFDNWTLLHARGDASDAQDRILLRSCVR